MNEFLGGLGVIAFFVAMVGAWVTHVVACIQAGAYLLLLAGAFIFPVGIIHGVMIWFGVPWAG